MPWKNCSPIQPLTDFIRRLQTWRGPFAVLCRRSGISRKTGYKWRQRWQREGLQALRPRPPIPRQHGRRHSSCWRQRLRQARRRFPYWGSRKLRLYLASQFGRRALPAASTLGLWLHQEGLIGQHRRRRWGPAIAAVALTQPRRPNQVWTVDFKGWFRTRDGTRVDPLTIRDLFSRLILCLRLLVRPTLWSVQTVFRRLFVRSGLPNIIRVDQGVPFASKGPRALSLLSVWWLSLGIRVEFTRRARPGDNAAHEQMHRVLQQETAEPPAATLRAQQRRSDRWRVQYNRIRPHDALAGRTPHSRYRPSTRRYGGSQPWRYSVRETQRSVRSNGRIKWQGRLRFIGRAFVGQVVGLRRNSADGHAVYLGPYLLGELRDQSQESLRAVVVRPSPAHPSQTAPGHKRTPRKARHRAGAFQPRPALPKSQSR